VYCVLYPYYFITSTQLRTFQKKVNGFFEINILIQGQLIIFFPSGGNKEKNVHEARRYFLSSLEEKIIYDLPKFKIHS